MAEIVFYENGLRVKKTSQAFNIVEKKELMREWTLTFDVLNTDSAREYIKRGAIYEIDGQKFDNKRFTKNTGRENISSVTMAYHVSRRLSNYIIPAGYGFAGQLKYVLQDILKAAKNKDDAPASSEFSVGECADVGTISYSLPPDNEVTARQAIEGLIRVGVEPSYDNFTVNAPKRWGANTAKIYTFGRDLCDVTIQDDQDNDTVTYTIDIAVLYRLPGGSPSDKFEVGDTNGILDELYNNSVTGQRVICYEKHHDDPTRDAVTLGQFVSDFIDTIKTMEVDINKAQSSADAAKKSIDGCVQVGKSYNNADISHEYGFRSTSEDGLMRTVDNGTDGFAIQQKINNNWVTLWQAKIESGKVKVTAYNPDHTLKTEQCGADGFAAYAWENGDWKKKSWLSAGGLSAKQLLDPDGTVRALIGKILNDWGLQLLDGDMNPFFGVYNGLYNGFTIKNGENKVMESSYRNNSLELFAGSDSVFSAKEGSKVQVGSGKNGSGAFIGGDKSAAIEYITSTGDINLVACTSDGPSFLKNSEPHGANGATPEGQRPVFENGICTSFTT